MAVAVAAGSTGIQQFFDSSGNELAGGFVYTYVGANPYPTYIEATGTFANTNPIVLNSRGEIANSSGQSCPMYLQTGVVYSLTVQDYQGNTIYTVPNVQAPYNSAGLSTLLTQNYIGGILYPQSAAELAAGVTPTDFGYVPGNVLRYGADPTGNTACDNATKAAISVMCAAATSTGGVGGLGNHTPVYYPAGVYKHTTTAFWNNPLWPNSIRGALITGDGNGSTIIYLSTGGTTTLYAIDGKGVENTGSFQQQYITLTVQNLCIMGDNSSLANAYRFYTTQGTRWDNVYFNNLYTTGDHESATGQGFGGDTNIFFKCKWTNIAGPNITYNNNQCFNNHFHACSMEQMTGTVFQVNTNGGGGMELYGGSYLMQGNAQTWLLSIVAGASLADNNNRFVFRDLDISLQQTFGTAGLLQNLGNTGQEATRITFDDCTIQQVGVANQQSVINYQGHVEFSRCALTSNQGMQYLCYGPSAGGAQYGDAGTIIFSECEVPINLSTYCSTPLGSDNLAWGYISARECYSSSFISGTARNIRTAVDFDLNWQNAGRCYNPVRLKKFSGTVSNYAGPAAGGSFPQWTVNLPNFAIIVRITVYRTATSSNIAYNLYVGNGNQSTVYGSVTGSNCNVSQTISVDYFDTPANWIYGGNTNPNNQVAIWSTAAGVTDVEAGSNFYFIVEYY